MKGGISLKLKMMIVDDSKAFREIIRELLARVGVDDVVEAVDFDEAIERYKAERPDMVLIDMILPGRSGVETTGAILEFDKGAKIIAMSSMVNKKLIKEALGAGAKDFLLKPTNEMALSTVIQMWGGE
ncbi:MAG TPA: response regulator [Thermoplasmata archaeon]|nr:response regulator [Thermoplasmata archaeon]